jgi:hypothetical protein
VLAVDGGAAEFENLAADRFIGSEVELLFTVVTKVVGGGDTGLHAIGAHNLTAGAVFDDEVIAEEVELIVVEAGLVGRREPFA